MTAKKSYNGCWTLFAIAGCAIPFGIFLFWFGNISGEEFSPDDFTRRRFHYNKMPLFGIVVQGIKYDDTTPVFEQTLFADGFLGKTTNGNQAWHLISDNTSDQDSPDFDAKYLTAYLDLVDDTNISIWDQWNRKYPNLAVEFWPIIAGLARESLYLDASDLMLNAMSLQPSDLSTFEYELKKKAVAALKAKADQAMSDQNYQDAVRLHSRVIEIEPNRESFLSRANGYKNLGDEEKYRSDKKAADDLIE